MTARKHKFLVLRCETILQYNVTRLQSATQGGAMMHKATYGYEGMKAMTTKKATQCHVEQ